MLLEGIFAPVTTCFHADGRPYWRKFEQNLERYSRTPLSGLVVLGSTGEAVMLSDEESQEALRLARGAVAFEKVLLAGVGRESVVETLRMAEFAARCEYDALLVRTPHYYRPQMRVGEMLAYYRTVADRAPLPVLLYSVPVYTNYDLPVEVIAELASHPNIIGMKDSSGSVDRVAQIVSLTRGLANHSVTVTNTFAAVTGRMSAMYRETAPSAADGAPAFVALERLDSRAAATVAAPPQPPPATRTKMVGFQFLSGAARILHAALESGATGAVVAIADFAPQATHEIYTAWKDRDAALAAEKQQRMLGAEDEISRRLGIPGVKYAMDFNGYYGGWSRMPLLPLTGEEKRSVETLLAGIRS